MERVPKKYEWLLKEEGPKVILEALRHYGTLELKGKDNNPEITKWAIEVGGPVGRVYTDDSIPWCGLFVAVVVKRCGYLVVKDPLWALNWGKFGQRIDSPMLGDIITFQRPTGGHVGFYVGEDDTTFHVLGGNQSDKVNIIRIEKGRAKAFRRPVFKIGQPKEVRKIYLSSEGVISQNEA
jgi:uncharacterized protein (TIGR02594 family)